jgi:hypothetical protein
MDARKRCWRISLSALAIALVGTCCALGEDHVNLQPGNWQVTMAMEMEGVAAVGAMPPTVLNHCIKPEDVKDPKTIAEGNQSKDRHCQVSDVKVENGKVSYGFTCDRGTTGQSEITYSGTSYEGTIVMTVAAGAKPMKLTQHVKGKRLGDC